MKNICLVVGHRMSSKGASNEKLNITEFDFNTSLAQMIASKTKLNCVVIYREDNKDGYENLPKRVNAFNFDLIISLHNNAFNKKVEGHEVLYYNTSSKSKAFAIRLNNCISNALENSDRGIKAIYQGDRGANILKNTNAPCVLIEPLFIDNNNEINSNNLDIILNNLSDEIVKELEK